MALSRDGLYDQIIKRLEQILDEAADLDGAFGALEAETDALRRELDGLDLGLHRFETSIDLGAQRASFADQVGVVSGLLGFLEEELPG